LVRAAFVVMLWLLSLLFCCGSCRCNCHWPWRAALFLQPLSAALQYLWRISAALFPAAVHLIIVFLVAMSQVRRRALPPPCCLARR
jgi:hypothetical protein